MHQHEHRFTVISPTIRSVTNIVAAAVAALAVAFSVFAWRLSAGPVSLAFLTPYVQDALKQTDSPLQIEFSDTILTWAGWDRALDIRILNVRAVGVDGEVAAVAPEISISLSTAALWRGMIAPTVLEIFEPAVKLVRNADGSVEYGLGDQALQNVIGDTSDSMELMFADLLVPPNETRAMGYLERISFIRGRLSVSDKSLGKTWTAPLVTVNITRSDNGIAIKANLLIDIAGRASEVVIRTRYRGQGRGSKFSVNFADVRPEWIAGEWPGLEALSAGRFPVSGALELSLDDAANLIEVAFNLNAEAGRLDLPQWYDDPIVFTHSEVIGTYTPAQESLRIDHFVIDLGGPKITLGGNVEGFNAAPSITADIVITDLAQDDLARYWPVGQVPDVRDWITRNITGGMITKSEITVNLRSGDLDLARLPAAAISATIELEGISIDYYDPLPKVVGVNGFGTIAHNNFEIRLWDGRSEGLKIPTATVRIEDLGVRDDTTIEVQIEGDVGDVLQFLAHPLLDYPQKLGIDPEAVSGRVNATLGFTFPITYQLGPEAMVITATSTLTDVYAVRVFDGWDMSGGPLTLNMDGTGLDLAGPVSLGAVSGEGTWRENFSTDTSIKRRYTFASRITDTQRLALGLPGGDYITGPTDISVEITDTSDGSRRWRVAVDLDDALIRIPELHWEKPAGVVGLLDLALQSTPEKSISVDSFTLAAGDLIARGRADFDPENGALRRLDLDKLAFGETDVRAAVVIDENGAYRMSIKGPSLDLRSFIESEDADQDLPDMSIAASIERLITRDDQSLTAVEITMRSQGGLWEAVRVDGELADDKTLSLGIRRDDGRRVFWMQSNDGGEVLRALDIFDDAIGGELTVLAALDSEAGDGAIKGELKIKNFTLRKVPLLARILTVATLTGVFDLLAGDGLPFSRLVVPFTKRGDLLDIKDARAFGPAIGFTFKGRIDQAAETADLVGTLVPAYALNSIFGKIPILGTLLVGEEDGGVFAMTYKLSGPLADPKISINPLAVLAPGILRGLFDFKVDNSESNTPPPLDQD